jgi:hypothetical protein
MYLASSVVNALKQKSGLMIFNLDLVACPVESCITKPEHCSKGQNKSCVKKIDIVYEHDNHNKVATLFFYYQLNGKGTEGFVRKEDLAFKVLLKRGIINSDALAAA